jgi:hypothetical protein
VGGFMAFLAEVGAERDENQQTKTRWALDHYAAKLRRPPPRKSAARKTTAAKTAQRPPVRRPASPSPGHRPKKRSSRRPTVSARRPGPRR